MLFPYHQLLQTTPAHVSEKKGPYLFLTEKHIQALWWQQKYFKNLKTAAGQPITILSPGIWNSEAGPDFVKAHIKVGEHELRGDVEIHLHDESWVQHGHHADPRYDNVVLHLSYWKPKHTIKPIVTNDDKVVLMAHLEDFITVPLARLLQLIDIDLYPYQKFTGSGRCAQQLFRKLPEDEAARLFSAAAAWRLEQKKLFLQAHFSTSSLQLAGGIAMALGYKNNTEAFLDLFHYLLTFRDLPYHERLAIALGCSGFFEPTFVMKWNESEHYRLLHCIWKGKMREIIHQTQLRLDGIRPLNHPIRRLAYLAHLIGDPALDRIWDNMLSIWKEGRTIKPVTLLQSLIGAISTYDDDYWNHHYLFETEAKAVFIPLIGDDRKREMLINAFLPLLHAAILEEGDPKQLEIFNTFYNSIRASHSHKSDYLVHRFFGDTAKGKLLNHAQMEQGAFQLHKDFCVHYEASCEGCPFVERFTALASR